ncbi:MAG: antitermination regulator, partial [Bacillota bacterium]
GILMDRFDLAESEAYKRLRDTAMRQRKPLREIAQSIIEFTALDETGHRRSGRGRR